MAAILVDKEYGLSVNAMDTAGNSGFNEYEMLDLNTKSSVNKAVVHTTAHPHKTVCMS
jgi:hypothetical protein